MVTSFHLFRRYEILADESLVPSNLKSLVGLMKSKPMFKLLTKLTGLKLAELETEDEKKDCGGSSSSSELLADSHESNSCCSCEIRHWSHGSYTLMHDTDPGLNEFALDAMLFFDCDGEIFPVYEPLFIELYYFVATSPHVQFSISFPFS